MDTKLPTDDDLKAKILEQIECGAICPKSRLIFKSRECVLWALWLVTIILGALAIAVSFFVVLQQTYSLYEITHSSFLTFLIETLPFLWFSIFLLMVIFAIYNLRHTKKGYRYPLWQIFGSSLVLSLAGGALLHLAGIGYVLDRQMGLLTDYYESQEKREQKIWQQPEQGRLLGRLQKVDNEVRLGTLKINFLDQESVVWLTDISELEEDELILLNDRGRVRLLGEVLSITPPHFHACAALPWLQEKAATRLELNHWRQRLVAKSKQYVSLSGADALNLSPCVRRFGQLRLH